MKITPARATSAAAVVILLWGGMFLATRARGGLVFDQGVWDAGVVPKGRSVSHAFRFSNDSARHISIAGIESGCYCTTALSSSEAIAPGAIGELVVTLDTSPFDGPTSKRISVRTSGGEAHTYSLEIRAHVVPEFTVSSRYIEFSSSEDIADRKEVVVTSEGGAAPAVAAARSTDPNVTVVLSSDPSDSRTVRITLTRLRPDRPVFGNLIVETTSQWEPELRIPLRGS